MEQTVYTPEEKAEHRAMLVKALRSGDYKQTRGCLRNRDGFCCLGVASDLFDKYQIENAKDKSLWASREDPNSAGGFYFGCRSNTAFLSKEVQDFFGFKFDNGHLIETVNRNGRVIGSLIGLNDYGLCSFEEIATQIEKGNVELALE